MKRTYLTTTIGGLLLGIFALLLFMFQVRQTEVALVTTFGKPSRHIDQPGPYFKLPWPIQRVQKFDRRIQNFEDKFEETLTQDGKNLLVTVYAGWRIKDAALFRERFDGSVVNAERSLEGLVRDAKNAVIGQHPFAHFISTNPEELKFEQIENEILTKIKAPALANYGIEIDFLGIKKLGLPESITAKVFERMKQERQKYVQEIQGQAERESIRIRSAADRERAELLARAQGEATRIRGQAEAEASQSLRALEQNPELALFLLKLNSMEEVLKERATLILDQRTPPFDLLKGVPTDTKK